MTATLSGYQLLETLHSGGKTVIYRGRRETDNTSVVIKTIAAEYPTIEEIARLRHEYKIIASLQIPGVIKSYELKNYQHGLALVLESFSGASLKEIINHQNTSLTEFLQIAIALAQTLGELHAQNIIHKDIKPHNILINPKSGEVKLIDFSISSRLDKENPTISNPNLLEGTLAYMSPEQTGRMNRAIDYRTDFYSLGVTFYEMLTGTLPFHASDPMELVHCHIAKTPALPCQDTVCRVLPEVPEAIIAIIFKLLAKTAEGRYQSAWGLKADLEECLLQLQATGKIENFVPGRLDKFGQFLIPQKLYGREQEVAQILAAFERVANPSLNKIGQAAVEMVLVSGYSGIGKTCVVNEVHKPIVGARGYFISGKFDQFKRNIPYASLIEAFQSLIGQLLTESTATIEACKTKLLKALGENGQVIIDVIPDVELIIGTQTPVAQLGVTESQNRFNRVFKQFINVFTTKEHPLVIFLDDLQWADSASLNLIELLMTDTDSQYLLLIGAYRDNEVSPIHPLMMSLEKIKSFGAAVNNIVLAPLKLTNVEELIADTLQHKERTKALAELLFNKTGGNPFFLTQLLKTLYSESLLTYEFTSRSGEVTRYGWHWNLEQIQSVGITDLNVVELVARNIGKLPEDTQKVLKLAACIGNTFNLEILAIVNQESSLVTAAQLWSSLQAGLIVPLSRDYKIPLVFAELESGSITLTDFKVDYKFLHDRVQQAAYSLIPDEEKKSTHLKIGQLLLQSTTLQEQRENIFALVNQLNYGTDLLTTEEEKYELASLNLIAGQKAKAATAHDSAVKYLQIALELLAENSWKCEYSLTLALYSEAAEAALLSGNFNVMQRYVEVVQKQAETLLDKIKVYEVQIQAHVFQNKLIDAVNTALQTLKLLEIQFPEQVTPADIGMGLQETAAILNGQSIEDLVDLPQMSDPYKLAAMRLLSSIFAATLFVAPQLVPLTVCKQVNLSVQYGNAAISPFAYVNYAYILCAIVGDIDSGYQFGQLAIRLVSLLNAKEISTKTYLLFNIMVRHWKEHARNSLKSFVSVYSSGLETGDLEYGGYGAATYGYYSYFVGTELAHLEPEMATYTDAIQKIKQETALNFLTIHRQAVLNLMGRNPNLCILRGEAYDEEKMLPLHQQTNDRMSLYFVYFNKTLLCYWFQEYSEAIRNAEIAAQYLSVVAGAFVFAIFHFYDSLVRLAVYSDYPQSGQQEVLERVRENQEKMLKWAQHSPSNYLHKYYLVEAERHRVLGEKLEALEMYDQAIALAKENEYINDEAVAHELAAKFYLSWGKETTAKAYMTNAYYAYMRWGALAKVKHLDQKYPQLIARAIPTEKHLTNFKETIHTSTGTTSGTGFILDLATVHKASLVLSKEIVLSHLLQKMMKIVIENAGAYQGYFITKEENQWLLEAVGTVAGDDISVSTSELTADSETNFPLLPVAVLNYVERTQQNLILDNAVQDSRFEKDTYIVSKQPKAILCLPLIHSGKFTGIIYLENNLIQGAFTPDRVNVLNLLSSQISIAVDNARLYTNLQNYSHQLEQSLQKLQQTQAQLVQTEKISSLGQLVAGVAHEVNNPVSFINGNLHHASQYVQDLLGHLELYQQKYPNPDQDIVEHAEDIDLEYLLGDLPKMLSSMKIGTDRIKDIMLSLRNFSRTDTAQKKPADIHAGIDSTVMILHHRLKATSQFKPINIVREYGNLPVVECYAGSLNQAFMNILANAIDAMEEVRKISEKEIRICTELVDEEVVIRIKDNGPGMTEEVRKRLFDAFFTTKPEGKGTGLGLSISYQIVTEKHGGKLTCTSVLGEGAEFAIAIPLR